MGKEVTAVFYVEGISASYISSMASIDGEDYVDEVVWGGGGLKGRWRCVCVCVCVCVRG